MHPLLMLVCHRPERNAEAIEGVQSIAQLLGIRYGIEVPLIDLAEPPPSLPACQIAVLVLASACDVLPPTGEGGTPGTVIVLANDEVSVPRSVWQQEPRVVPLDDGTWAALLSTIERTPSGMTLLHEALMREIGFTEAQLAANRSQRITPEQVSAIRQNERAGEIGCVWLPALILGAATMLLGSPLLLLGLGLLMLWVLGSSWDFLRRRTRKLSGTLEFDTKQEALYLRESASSRSKLTLTRPGPTLQSEAAAWFDQWEGRRFTFYLGSYVFTDYLLSLEATVAQQRSTDDPVIGILFADLEASYAGRIRDHLARAYGPAAIRMGETVTGTLDSLNVLLVIVGPDWEGTLPFAAEDTQGNLLADALYTPGLMVAPVLVNDASLDDDLPAAFDATLAVRLSDYSFAFDLGQLLRRLELLPGVQARRRAVILRRFAFDQEALPLNREGRMSEGQLRWMVNTENLWAQLIFWFIGALIPIVLTVLLLMTGQAGWLVSGSVLLSALMIGAVYYTGTLQTYMRRLRVIEGRVLGEEQQAVISAQHLAVDEGDRQRILYMPVGLSRYERQALTGRPYRFFTTVDYRLLNLEPLFDDAKATEEFNAQPVEQRASDLPGWIMLVLRQRDSLAVELRNDLEATYGTGAVTVVTSPSDVGPALEKAAVMVIGVDAGWGESELFGTQRDVLTAALEAVQQHAIPVLPVLMNGAVFPPSDLMRRSPALDAFGRTNALALHSYNFAYGAQRLTGWLSSAAPSGLAIRRVMEGAAG